MCLDAGECTIERARGGHETRASGVLEGFFPSRTAWAARRWPRARRCGSGCDLGQHLVDLGQGNSRSQGTPVNWHRWVTSCRAIHNRNCRGEISVPAFQAATRCWAT